MKKLNKNQFCPYCQFSLSDLGNGKYNCRSCDETWDKCPRCKSPNIKVEGVSGQQESCGNLIDVDIDSLTCEDCGESWSE